MTSKKADEPGAGSIADDKEYMPLPRYGIFGPVRSLKDGLSIEELLKPDNNGAVLEFCTDEITESMAREDKYFGTPDVMKCSYLLDNLDAASDDDDDTVSSFQRLSARMANVTEDGGVKKLLLNEGVGAVVMEGAHIRANYHAFLEDMVEPFDSSYLQGRELQITLGTGGVIPGLDLAIGTMRKKEKARFLINPGYAYGTMGCPPRIPPDVTILFEVELLSFTDSTILDECNQMSQEERKRLPFEKVLAIAKAQKNEGNEFFRENMYTKAQHKFSKCINALESVNLKNEIEEMEMMKVTTKAYQNMALCHLRLGNFGRALEAARHVLEYDPENPKALYIAGKSLRHIGSFSESRKYMLRAMQIAPGSNDVIKELKLIDKNEERFNQAEVTMCKKMFNSCNLIDFPAGATGTKKKVQIQTAAPSFQKIITERLEKFKNDACLKELLVPIATFTQSEIYCTANAAEDLGFGVELIDKPGKQKCLKIMK